MVSRKTRIPWMMGIACSLLMACSSTQQDCLGEMPVIAKKVTLPTGDLIVCDLAKATDTLDVPLSMLTEELQIVPLDNRDEALVGGWVRTTVSDNYILVSNNRQVPYKLFGRDGKFICTVGSFGQGPNEYQLTYAEQLDEQHDRIYIMSWNADKILVFDLKGNPQPYIPLNTRVPKGKFRVNTADSTVIVTKLPFEGSPEVVWVQDMHGNRKQSVAPGHLMVPRDFSNEVMDARNTSAYDVMLLTIMPEAKQDSLYHYNLEKNRLEPRFTTLFTGEKIPWHGYTELPHHFIGDGSFPVRVSATTFQGSAPAYYIVDKTTLKGNFMRLKNDFLHISAWPSFSNGYYTANMEPMTLKEQLEEALREENLDESVQARIKACLSSLDENGNNVILLAKLKN
ncbi:uncharacterized protein BN646_01912 [Parabacteroides sp. CAG:409]|nr:uncharacterized protein BN646_01912 [Parabacteroides sp. CAG:409]